MPNGTIDALKRAIAGLEQELKRHRRALQVLEGRDGALATTPPSTKAESRPAKTAARRRSAPAQTKKATPAARRATRGEPRRKQAKRSAPQVSTTQLIRDALATASAPMTPAEIVGTLSRRGHTVVADNVHRRLSDMAKSKVVTRAGGKYTIAKA